MPQCPECKKPSRIGSETCKHCDADLRAAFGILRLPTETYNAGLDALARQDDLEAIVNLAATTNLSDDPRPWTVLADIFDRKGLNDLAADCRGRSGGDSDGTSARSAGSGVEASSATERPERRRLWLVAAAVPVLLVAGMMLETIRRGPASDPVRVDEPRIVRATSTDTVYVEVPVVESGVLADSTSITDEPSLIRHTVRAGETLWEIARRYYGRGSAWPNLTAIDGSEIADPRRIRVGMELLVESTASSLEPER